MEPLGWDEIVSQPGMGGYLSFLNGPVPLPHLQPQPLSLLQALWSNQTPQSHRTPQSIRLQMLFQLQRSYQPLRPARFQDPPKPLSPSEPLGFFQPLRFDRCQGSTQPPAAGRVSVSASPRTMATRSAKKSSIKPSGRRPQPNRPAREPS